MKIISEKTVLTRSFRKRLLFYSAAMLILAFIHVVFLQFIEIKEVTPDLLLILCVWIVIVEGRFTGLFAAFIIGFFYDVVSVEIIGVNALAKIVAAYLAGWFYVEEKSNQVIKSYKFPLAVFLCALANNIIDFLFNIQLNRPDLPALFLLYGFGGAFYSAFFSLFAILLKLPRKSFKLLK